MISKNGTRLSKPIKSENANEGIRRVKKLEGNITKVKLKEWLDGKDKNKSTLFDNNNLYLRRRTNKHTWMIRYKLGSEKNWNVMSLGKFSEDGTLGMDVQMVREYYVYTIFPLLNQGLNPKTELLKSKEENSLQSSTLFKEMVDKWFEERINNHFWKNDYVVSKVRSRFRNHILPKIGEMSCVSITESDIQDKVLSPLLSVGKLESTRRVFTYLRDVFDDLESRRLIQHNPMNLTRGWLSKRIKKFTHNKPEKHLPSITNWKILGEFLCEVEDSKPSIKTYYSHLLLTFTVVRINNVVESKWSEFFLDSKNPYWLIPKEKMKVGLTDLKVPLSKQIVKFLKEYRKICQEEFQKSEYLFPSNTMSGHITIDNLEKFYRVVLGYRDIHSPHGIRSSFSTLGNKHHPLWEKPIELCLHHQVGSKVQRAYNRSDVDWMLKEKREVLQWWGDMLEKVWKEESARMNKK